ncbi:MAG: tetratricopeptide repeat protein [Hormoscilla sp. GM7CHS1pb]|nr:tetratricopeptide repeat protein [Hormoscilla sp. GM7CHS1pb]
MQRYQEAIASYDKTLSIKADFPEAWNNRGGAMAGATLRDWRSCSAIKRLSSPTIGRYR